MQRLEVSGAVRLIYRSLGVKGISQSVHKLRICRIFYGTKLLMYVAQTEWRWGEGCGMFADSSGSKLICACVETKKKEKTERKQMA